MQLLLPDSLSVERAAAFRISSSGALSLKFDYDHDRNLTVVRLLEQRPPLKLVRAFAAGAGAALIHLHNISGGVLGGDELQFEFEIEPCARAQITSTGATRLYRSRVDRGPARCSSLVRVRENALLEYLPDPLIPFAGSRYYQDVKIELDAGAGLFWWEIVAPGREAHGEAFAFDEMRLALKITAEGIPIAIERARLEPAAYPVTSLARLGAYRYWSSFYICRAGTEAGIWEALEAELIELSQQLSHSPVIIWGLSRLPAHGLILRALSSNGREIASGLVAFWRAAKKTLYGQAAVIPRKVY